MEKKHERAGIIRTNGISLPKAYKLVKEPGFSTIKVGARILIPVGAFRKWLI